MLQDNFRHHKYKAPPTVRFHGHVVRMSDDRWPKKMLDWVPRSRRGTLVRSWKEDVLEEVMHRGNETIFPYTLTEVSVL